MKAALLVRGGWEGHEPGKCIDIFAPFLEREGFEVEVSDTLEVYTDEEKMRTLSLVVPCWTMGQITPEQEKGLLDALRGGVGIAGWHKLRSRPARPASRPQWVPAACASKELE